MGYMSTVDKSSMQGIHNQIEKNPSWLPVLARLAKEMSDNKFPLDYLDAIFQSTQDYPDIYVAYCFAMIDAWIQTGKVMTAKVEIGYEPCADKEIEMNNEILQYLPPPFWARFQGIKTSQDRTDGSFGWKEPVEFGQVIYSGKEITEMFSPRQIALEVGTTKADRTFTHIVRGGVARWPYESFYIWLFVPSTNFIDRVMNARSC